MENEDGKVREDLFMQSFRQLTGFKLTKEFRFHPTRKWRFDYCHFDSKVAIEVDGGVFTQGRHTRGKGFIGDMEKLNNAAMLGWSILRFQPSTLLKMATFEMISNTIKFKYDQKRNVNRQGIPES
jgi:very-short-patch-repair endonuclease